MIELWLLFGLFAALSWALTNTIDKYVLSKLVKNPIAPIIVSSVIGVILSISIYFVKGFDSLSYIHISLALLNGAIYLILTFFYFKALQIEEMSRIVPLFYVSPLFILIFAFLLLEEILKPINYFGVLLLIIGAVLINYKKGINIKFGKAFWFMMISSLALSLSEIIRKYLLDYAEFWTILSYGFIGTFITLGVMIIFKREFIKELAHCNFKTLLTISTSSVTNLTGIFLLTVGLSLGSVTLVNAVASLQPLFVLLIAIILSIFIPKIIKEEISRGTIIFKLISIILMIIGVMMVS